MDTDAIHEVLAESQAVKLTFPEVVKRLTDTIRYPDFMNRAAVAGMVGYRAFLHAQTST